jgi:molybdopterin converting factor small subunit
MTRILFLGRTRDAAGCGEMDCEIPAAIESVADLRAWIASRDPHLGAVIAARDIRVVADQCICINERASIRGASEIAFMPPLSGG